MITIETSVKAPSVKLSIDINAKYESFLFSTLTSTIFTGGWWWKQLQVEVGVLDIFCSFVAMLSLVKHCNVMTIQFAHLKRHS